MGSVSLEGFMQSLSVAMEEEKKLHLLDCSVSILGEIFILNCC